MKLKEIDLGKVKLKNNVFLAPIAGFTDFSLRGICSELGSGLCFTELVSCKGLVYESVKTAELLITDKREVVKAAQIFGSDPEIMGRACKSAELAPFDIVDINMGCPVPKLYKNGEGSALLEKPRLASEIIKSCVKSGKTVTVKIRTAIKNGAEITEDFAKMCEDSGAAMLTVHGRARENYYSGAVNFEEIAKAKRAVKIPVIANGGVFCASDADILSERTGADGIMIARGALYDPFIFCELTNTPPPYDKKQLILSQIDSLEKKLGGRYACVTMRKRIAYYMKGMPNVKKYKNDIFACEDFEKLKEILTEAF